MRENTAPKGPEGTVAMSFQHSVVDARFILNSDTLLETIAKASIESHDGDIYMTGVHAGELADKIGDLLEKSGESTESQVVALVTALGLFGHDLSGQAIDLLKNETGIDITKILSRAASR